MFPCEALSNFTLTFSIYSLRSVKLSYAFVSMIPFLLVNIFAFDNSCSISLSYSLTFAFLLKLYSLLNKQGMWRPKHWEYSLRSALWCASLIINILWVQTLSAKANILFILYTSKHKNKRIHILSSTFLCYMFSLNTHICL